MLEYLSLDIICSEKKTAFRERNSRKTAVVEPDLELRGEGRVSFTCPAGFSPFGPFFIYPK